MTTQTCIYTMNDLRCWLEDHYPDMDAADRGAAAERIQRGDHPDWGADWRLFLDGLKMDDLFGPLE